MTVNESWIYQGRQGHGWFGDGTSPHEDAADAASGTAAPMLAQRIHDIGHTFVAGLPSSKRHHDAARLGTEDQARLGRLLTATVRALPMGGPTIARSVFGVHQDAAGLADIILAARLLRDGKDNADLRAATDALGRAAQAIGLDRFKPFLRDADAHLVQHGGLLTLARAMPGMVLQEAAPSRGLLLLGEAPWAALLGGVLALLPTLAALAERGDVRDVIEDFHLSRAEPADVVAAYAYLWAENHGPWLFDTPQTGPAMEAMARRVMWIARADPELFRNALAGDVSAQREVTKAVLQPAEGGGIETQTQEEHDLVASMQGAGRTQEETVIALDALRNSRKLPTAEARRNARGNAFASRRQPNITTGWLLSTEAVEIGAVIPRQIADKLIGRSFASFGALREAIWKAVAAEPKLAAQFTGKDLKRMMSGAPPSVSQKDRTLTRDGWVLHRRSSL